MERVDNKQLVKDQKWKRKLSQPMLYIAITLFAFLTLVPIIFMLFLSLKNNAQIYGSFWALPDPFIFKNYQLAFEGIWKYIVNTVIYTFTACLFIVMLASVGGYIFAKKSFPGKELIFMLFLAMMMVPGLLTLIPSYVLHDQLGFTNTPWAIIIQHTAGGQIFGIFLCRSFMNSLPSSLFESARVDGASEMTVFFKIVVPLSTPILATVVVMQSVGIYNDYVWPLLAIRDGAIQVVSVGLTLFANEFGSNGMGIQYAGYALSALPLLLTFIFGMKYYIQGMTQGAIKM